MRNIRIKTPMGGGPARSAGSAAFTLIEILIVVVILGILAAIVIPQFSNASQVTRQNTLRDELRYLRTQLVVYGAQHTDTPPGYPGGNVTIPSTPDGLTGFYYQAQTKTIVANLVGNDSDGVPYTTY